MDIFIFLFIVFIYKYRYFFLLIFKCIVYNMKNVVLYLKGCIYLVLFDFDLYGLIFSIILLCFVN